MLRVGLADGLARDLEIVVGDGRAEFLAVGFGDGLRRGDALLRHERFGEVPRAFVFVG